MPSLNLKNFQQVEGGTGWSIQMAIDIPKKSLFLIKIQAQWYTYCYNNNHFIYYNTIDILPLNFCGIGTRILILLALMPLNISMIIL